MIGPTNLSDIFGQIDIYLFDQLLRGRIPPGSRILDAGCGSGRNLRYLLDAGYEVFAADSDPEAIGEVLSMAARLKPEAFLLGLLVIFAVPAVVVTAMMGDGEDAGIVAASPDGFPRASSSLLPRHRLVPCRSTHQVQEAIRVTL